MLVCLFAAGCNRQENTASPVADGSDGMRIISMAPNLTEILYALELEDRIVGVTSFCDYPPAAKKKPKIGGLYDANYESIVTLAPTLVLLLKEHQEARARLQTLGIEYMQVDNRSVKGILESIQRIGNKCGAKEKAQNLVESMRGTIQSIRSRRPEHPGDRPRVLISIGRAMGSGRATDVYVAGPDTIYQELTEIAGGRNAYEGNLDYPQVGAENILRMNPDIIIDMAADLEAKGLDKRSVREEWNAFSDVKAVRNDRVYVLTGDYVTVPGPRFVMLLEDIAAAIHLQPEEE